MRRVMQTFLTCLLVLSGLTVTPLVQSETVLAGNATVAACTEVGFNDALSTVQNSGGGVIDFDCTGVIPFTSQKTITSEVTIDGASEVTFDGGDSTRLFKVNDGARLVLFGLTLRNGSADGSGGAIENYGTLEVVTSTLSDNSASDDGGAVSNRGTATIIGSTVSGNNSGSNAHNSGGAISNLGRFASGTYVKSTLEITASAFTLNTAVGNGGAISGNGRVEVRASTFILNSTGDKGGAISGGSPLVITASTFNLNTATLYGGAISNDETEVTASTFVGNAAGKFGGAIANANFSSGFTGTARLTIRSSIIALSLLGANCYYYTNGVVTSDGHNLSDDTTCDLTGTGDQQGSTVPINLAGLQDNGGPTLTMAPQVGSAALDTADCTQSSARDQRGALRPSFNCDIGAVEVGATVPVQIFATYNDGPTSEGQTVEIVIVAFEPADAGLTYEFDCDNNGAFEISQSSDRSANCTFLDPGSFTVAVRASDGTTSATDATIMQIQALIPSITSFALSPTILDEGEDVALTANFTNADATATHTCTIDWDDGTKESGSVVESGGSGNCTGNHSYADDGDYTVIAKVCDNDGDCDDINVIQAVQNVAPAVDAGGDQDADEGDLVELDPATFSDPGTADTHNCTIDWDDGTEESGTVNETDGACAGNHSYGDDGSYTVEVCVTDDDGDSGCDTLNVEVSNVDPSITGVSNDSPINEGSPATIIVIATDPAGSNDPLTYSFDCDSDGNYETNGVGNQGQCTFGDNGSFIVGVQVTDDDGGSATDSTTVYVDNVAPMVNPPSVDSEPSNEGQKVTASASFTDPGTLDTHTCTVDYDDGSGPQEGTVDGLICTGPAHTYLDDSPSGTPSDDYNITIRVEDDDEAYDASNALHTVSNVQPTIESIATNGPVSQGQSAKIIVDASDVGVNDTLTYSFDCDDDGNYETPGAGNQGQCDLDPAVATTTIGVRVEDDDLGVTTGSVQIQQTITLCANGYSGALRSPMQNGRCPGNTSPLVLPAATPVTLCVNPYTRAVSSPASGSCPATWAMHIVPDDGPLRFCESRYTGAMRMPQNAAACLPSEIAGVIPG